MYMIGQLLEPVARDSAERFYLLAAKTGHTKALDRLERLHPWKRWFYIVKIWFSRRKKSRLS